MIPEAVAEQVTSPGGEHVAELVRPAVATGRHKGYLARTQSRFAVFGCTCGLFVDDTADVAEAAFREHIASDVFKPVDG